MNDLVLVELETARTALVNADTIQKTKKVLDVAIAAKTFAKRQKVGKEIEKQVSAFVIEAKKQLGDQLIDAPKNTGAAGRAVEGESRGSKKLPRVDEPLTLAEQGLDKKTSKEAQDVSKMAKESPRLFEQVLAGNLTLVKAKKELEKERNKNKPVAATPDGKYRVIYADPPWKYTSGDQHSNKAQDTTLTTHYNSMSIDELCGLPVKFMAEDNSVLFMWTTSPLLEESFRVINAWGFNYKASIVWNKEAHNVGHYVSVRHEFLLICTRGSCLPDTDKLLPSVVSEKRTEHSVKPETFRQIIDTLYTYGKRIELFARRAVEGWEVWGNEAIS